MPSKTARARATRESGGKPRCGVECFQGLWCPCGQSAEEAGEEKLHSQLKEKGEPEGPGNRRVLFSISLAQQSLCKFSYVLFGPAANWLPDRTGGRITILTQCYPETAETNKPLQSCSQPFQGSAHLSKACRLLTYLCRDWCPSAVLFQIRTQNGQV